MRVLHLDSNHPILIQGLETLGCTNEEDYTSSKEQVLQKIDAYQGIVIRSRFPIDAPFIDAAQHLKFIARVGAGLENIDTEYAMSKGIALIAAPEGNRNAVGEHCLGMLLSLLNKLHSANAEVKSGQWKREANRGVELDGKTVGLIGYGNMGKSFAKKLRGFDVEVLCYDIQEGVGDENARQVSLKEFTQRVTIVSLHTPQTSLTENMIDSAFIDAFRNPFWFLNTARGKSVVTADLVKALQRGAVLGAGLDVLEFEKASFESLFEGELPEALAYLMKAENVILSPHVAGWTIESHQKLAETIVEKISKIIR